MKITACAVQRFTSWAGVEARRDEAGGHLVPSRCDEGDSLPVLHMKLQAQPPRNLGGQLQLVTKAMADVAHCTAASSPVELQVQLNGMIVEVINRRIRMRWLNLELPQTDSCSKVRVGKAEQADCGRSFGCIGHERY